MIINIPIPFVFLQYQVQKYKELVKEARSREERMFRRREHYRLKQQLSTYFN